MARVSKILAQKTTDEVNQVFDFWRKNNKNVSLTARQFNLSRPTLYRFLTKNKWAERADKINQKIQDGIDRKIEKEAISNLELAKRCLEKEAKAYLKEDNKVTGNLAYIIGLMKYIDELQGNMPNVPNGNSNHTNIAGDVYVNLTVEEQRQQDNNLAMALSGQATHPRFCISEN